jgi:hypothetical protein
LSEEEKAARRAAREAQATTAFEPVKRGRGRPRKGEEQNKEEKKVIKDRLSAKALKLIKKADDLEVRIADSQDELRSVFQQLASVLPHPSFEHPERGPMTVTQFRGGTWAWRSARRSK